MRVAILGFWGVTGWSESVEGGFFSAFMVKMFSERVDLKGMIVSAVLSAFLPFPLAFEFSVALDEFLDYCIHVFLFWDQFLEIKFKLLDSLFFFIHSWE